MARRPPAPLRKRSKALSCFSAPNKSALIPNCSPNSLLLLCFCQQDADLHTNENENEPPFAHRTSAFVDTAELFQAVENTKLMWTERQRRMAKDALKASSDRFTDMMARNGVAFEETYDPDLATLANVELSRRQNARGVTIARREARVAKGQSRFVEG
jgi:hypothetical protein